MQYTKDNKDQKKKEKQYTRRSREKNRGNIDSDNVETPI